MSGFTWASALKKKNQEETTGLEATVHIASASSVRERRLDDQAEGAFSPLSYLDQKDTSAEKFEWMDVLCDSRSGQGFANSECLAAMGSPKVDRSTDTAPLSSTTRGSTSPGGEPSASSAQKMESVRQAEVISTKGNSQSQGPSPTVRPEITREFEPEGSPGMTPTSDESSTTPSYLRWQEDIFYLLNDDDGLRIFREYLDEENLGHILNFYFLCNGIKDQSVDRVGKVIKVTYKMFIASSGKSYVACLDADVREQIRQKLLSETGSSDPNIFDGAQQQVLEHLRNTAYINFFKSERYISYCQNFQIQSFHSPRQLSESHSASSSVCGKAASEQQQRQQGREQSSSSTDPAVPVATESENVDSSRSCLPSASNALLAAALVDSPSLCAAGSLQTVEEDTELTLDANSQQKKQKEASQSKPRQSPLTMETLQNSQESRVGLPGRRAVMTESYPATSSYGGYPTSGPYHAYSSTFNPTSRNSETQSASSGAMDDGAYSSFTDGSYVSSTFNSSKSENPYRSQHVGREQQMLSSSQSKPQTQDSKNRPASHKTIINKDCFAKNDVKGTRQGQLPPGQASQNNSQQFAEELIRKLQEVKEQQESDLAKNHKLQRCLDGATGGGFGPRGHVFGGRRGHAFGSLNALGVANNNNDESDQSILDEHCSRVFATQTPPNEMWRLHGAGAGGPGAGGVRRRRHDVSANASTMDASHIMSRSFHGHQSGHKTWGAGKQPLMLHGHGQRTHFGMNPMNASAHSESGQSYYERHYQQQGNSYPGDLEYFPSESTSTLQRKQFAIQQQQQQQQQQQPITSARSFSDFDYPEGSHADRYAASSRVPSARSYMQPQVPPYPDSRVSNWVRNQQNSVLEMSDSQPAFRTSSGRGFAPMSVSTLKASDPSLDAMASSKHMASSMEMRSHSHDRLNQSQPLYPAASGMQVPSAGAQDQLQDVQIFYNFPSSASGGSDAANAPSKYRVRCRERTITLTTVQNYCPRKGTEFRFFIFSKEDGEALLEEMDEFTSLVLQKGEKVQIECREK